MRSPFSLSPISIGLAESHPKWKETHIGDTPNFPRKTMITGGRGFIGETPRNKRSSGIISHCDPLFSYRGEAFWLGFPGEMGYHPGTKLTHEFLLIDQLPWDPPWGPWHQVRLCCTLSGLDSGHRGMGISWNGVQLRFVQSLSAGKWRVKTPSCFFVFLVWMERWVSPP